MDELSRFQRKRVHYYLGYLTNYKLLDAIVPEYQRVFVVTRDSNIDQVAEWLDRAWNWPEEARERKIRLFWRAYVSDVLEDLVADPALSDFAIPILPGDNRVDWPMPLFVKSCRASSRIRMPLMQLSRNRHWKANFGSVAAEDIAWEDKEERVVFRGAMTGRWTVAPGDEVAYSARYYLAQRAAEFRNHPLIDAGFTGLYERFEPETIAQFEASGLIKERMSVGDQLKYKYLLSLEGNDVASGLKWMLSSNSLVLATKPKMCSWAMEDRLAPGKHYVEVAYDLSDLAEKVAWCRNNDAACREIVANANALMKEFSDPAVEAKVRRAVYRSFIDRVRLTTSDPLYRDIRAANLRVDAPVAAV